MKPLALLAALLLAASASAQEPTPVLVLGTYHFANPGRDIAQVTVADVMTPERQAEIERIVEALAAFRPTKVMVERLPENAGRLDSLYAAYRAGTHTLARSEDEQIAFRLAARLGLDRVYPVDVDRPLPFGPLMTVGAEREPATMERIMGTVGLMEAQMDSLQRVGSVGETLRFLNRPDELARNLGMYLLGVSVGADAEQVGADVASAWYDRNIRIFAHIAANTEPGDRVFVLFGSGHAPILRHLVEATPGMTLVEPGDYLPD